MLCKPTKIEWPECPKCNVLLNGYQYLTADVLTTGSALVNVLSVTRSFGLEWSMHLLLMLKQRMSKNLKKPLDTKLLFAYNGDNKGAFMTIFFTSVLALVIIPVILSGYFK